MPMRNDPSRSTRLPRHSRHQLLHMPGPNKPVAQGELSDLLVVSTVWAALRVGRDRLPPALVLSRRAARLVSECLTALPQ